MYAAQPRKTGRTVGSWLVLGCSKSTPCIHSCPFTFRPKGDTVETKHPALGTILTFNAPADGKIDLPPIPLHPCPCGSLNRVVVSYMLLIHDHSVLIIHATHACVKDLCNIQEDLAKGIDCHTSVTMTEALERMGRTGEIDLTKSRAL